MENDNIKSGAGNADIAGTLSSLLANEELMKSIRSLFAQPAQAQASAQSAPSTADTVPAFASTSSQEKDGEASPQKGEVLPPAVDLQQLLSNPAVMEKLPQVMAMLSPMMNNNKTDEDAKAVSASPQRFNPQSRESLLCALKPFLSPNRQTAVDSIMRISQLGHILQQLK